MGNSFKDKGQHKGSNGDELKNRDKKSKSIQNRIQLLTGIQLHCTEKY